MAQTLSIACKVRGDICTKCGKEIKLQEQITWYRSGPPFGKFHTSCESIPGHIEDACTVKLPHDVTGLPRHVRIETLKAIGCWPTLPELPVIWGRIRAANISTDYPWFVHGVHTPVTVNPSVLAIGEGSAPATPPAIAKPPQQTAANGNSALLSMIAEGIAPLLEDKLRTKIDASQVESLIADKVQSALKNHTRTIIIEDRRTGETKLVQGRTHYLFPFLLELVQMGRHIALYGNNERLVPGAAGCGKTVVARQVAEALGRSFYYECANETMTKGDYYGRKSPVTNEYFPSKFRKAFGDAEKGDLGGVFFLDEGDSLHGSCQTSFNGPLDNRICSFPDSDTPIKAGENFAVIMAVNTPGFGADSTYSSRQRMDGAFRKRFFWVAFDADEKLELDVALDANPDAEPWVKWVQSVRRVVKEQGFRNILATPREGMQGAKLFGKIAVEQIADGIVFCGVDADTRRKIMAAVPFPKNPATAKQFTTA